MNFSFKNFKNSPELLSTTAQQFPLITHYPGKRLLKFPTKSSSIERKNLRSFSPPSRHSQIIALAKRRHSHRKGRPKNILFREKRQLPCPHQLIKFKEVHSTARSKNTFVRRRLPCESGDVGFVHK
jgi:hypothetical protein